MEEKPREKLASKGIKELEDHELLAIILSKGTKRENVFDLSKRLLKKFDHEELIQIKTLQDFQKSFEINHIHACQLMACIELGQRFFQKTGSKIIIRTAEDAYQIFKNMENLKKEYLRGLYLNSRYQLIHDEIIAIGTLNKNLVHPREVFKPALEYSAYAIILAHNHPSGDKNPSTEDKIVTKKLTEMGEMLQIPILDHLIIGENGYSSLNKQDK